MKKESKTLLSFYFCVLALLSLFSGFSSQQTAGELFEKALYVEEGQGDLQKAIGLYQDIVKRFAGEREIAAKALLHLGICYEKLGKTEARNAYNRLLRDYSDQLTLAKEARSRLAQLEVIAGARAAKPAGLTFRKLDIADAGHSHQARLSPDGSKFLYIGYQDKEPHYLLRVLDFVSGKTLTLVEGINADTATLLFEWSPDGNKVAYAAGPGELRVVDIEGGKSVQLWTSPEKETSVRPLDWSEQNHSLLISLINLAENTVRLAALSEGGGTPRTIVSGHPDELGSGFGQFSPDGKLIVGMERREKNVDVYVWEVEGGEETRITTHPAEDTYPLWSPDGKHIVFMSERAKSYDLWAVPMDGSQPAGEPFRLEANVGKNKVPSDLTRSGVLTFYAMSSAGTPSDLFVLPVDPKTGEAGGAFRPFANYPTKAQRWSPDGSRIAYTSRKGNIQLPNAYVVAGGDSEEIEIPARNYFMIDIEWARDGKSLIFPGWNNDDGLIGIFRISLDDQEIQPIHKPGERYGANFAGAYLNLRWLPLAGRYMFFRLLEDGKEEIFLMDPNDYQIERVAEKIGMGGYSIPSPDGRYLIAPNFKEKTINLLSVEDEDSKFLMALPSSGFPAISWAPDGKSFIYNEDRQLKVYSVPDGTARILVEASEGKIFGPGGFLSGAPNTAFSPDGTKIAYVLQDAGDGPGRHSELWIVKTAGGSLRKVADAPASHPLLGEVVWHPSGKTIFASGQTAESRRLYEHWVMENFLPSQLAVQAALEKDEGGFQVRKVWDKALDSFFMGTTSPDGRYLTYVDWEKFANLGVHDLVTGENRLLTDIKTWEGGEMCYGSIFSPDGNRIAYMHQTKGDMLIELRTVNLDGSSTRILHDGRGLSYQLPVGWAPDGKQILTLSWAKDESAKIASVSVADGSVKELKALSVKLPRTTRMSLSPDGKYIACTFLPQQDSANCDILILATEGGGESKLVEHPADDDVLGWAPDGKRFIFISDRTGTTGVWSVRVAEGKAEGIPELVRGDIGNINPLGMTRDGKLYYGIHTGWCDVFVVPIDPATGKATGQPQKVIRKYETFNSAPDWSPDGQFLVCRSSRGKMLSETPTLLIRSMQTGELREVNPKISWSLNFHFIRWTSDGRSILAIGMDDKGKYGALLAIDVQTGEVKIIARPESDSAIYYPDCAIDGKSIYFIRSGTLNRLIRLDLESGLEKELLSSSQPLGYFRFALSPDAQKIVVVEGDKIRIHSSDGTEPRELIEVKDVRTMAWTADGKKILYGKLQDGSQEVVDLWGIPAAGGERQKLGLTMSLLMHLRVNPDGKSIAFTASEQPSKSEVWVMENFLPVEKK